MQVTDGGAIFMSMFTDLLMGGGEFAGNIAVHICVL